MQLLDSLTLSKGAQQRTIELWHGDLTALDEPADFLVISAFIDSYRPTPDSMMEALDRRGVSVDRLAKDKLIDLRETTSCWVSHPIPPQARVPFRQIVCFEPRPFSRRPEPLTDPTLVVSNIFRCLVPFICAPEPRQVVAMPLLCTGSMDIPVVDMLESLFAAGTHWMEHGLPLKKLMIVEHSRAKAAEAQGVFRLLKKQYGYEAKDRAPQPPRYDIFISYSHKNRAEVDFLVAELAKMRPDLRVFIDHQGLTPGDFWQEKLFRSVDDARKVVCLYSPDYITSKNCMDEFNLALTVHRQAGQNILFPIFLHAANLPLYMNTVHYEDCCEADPEKLRKALGKLVEGLGPDEIS